MASSSPIIKNISHFRSISMPLRSHPNTIRIEEAIIKLNTFESSSSLKVETICIRLAGLSELYICLDDLLQIPLTQQALLQHQQKWVTDELDGSVRLLDVCAALRDVLLQMKEHARVLRSALRRRGGESCMEKKINPYISFRKKMKKHINKCIVELKRIDCQCGFPPQFDQDQHREMVIRVLREVRAITISIFQSLMSFMSESTSKSKPNRWTLVSKLMQKRKVACEGKHGDLGEVEYVDVAAHTLSQHILSKDAEVEWVQKAQKGLEALEASIEGLESGLDCVFRRLIQTRVSLLNIFTH